MTHFYQKEFYLRPDQYHTFYLLYKDNYYMIQFTVKPGIGIYEIYFSEDGTITGYYPYKNTLLKDAKYMATYYMNKYHYRDLAKQYFNIDLEYL